ncbi:hypothetical protein AB0H71_16255 [Nocardia sp. NPDC050697]|uniref:hypothetical protein n=1 Tax=Nocardia sp. NPDC050697 TaxID=3155158 RepID=UPI0033F2DF5C
MFGRKKKPGAAQAPTVRGATAAEHIIVLYRDAAPDRDELIQLIATTLGPAFGSVPVSTYRVDEPTRDMALAMVAMLIAKREVNADALERTSTKPFETRKGPVVLAVVGQSVPGTVGQRLCPHCGSPDLRTDRRPSTVERRLDDKCRIAVDITVTVLQCGGCGTLLNDDMNGDVAATHARLAAQTEKPRTRTSATVRDALEQARRLPALSELERQQDHDRVRGTWGCLGLRHVAAENLEDAVVTIVDGFIAEGASEIQVRTLKQHVLQLSFITAAGFCPARIARAAEGGFAVYGVAPVYRFLDSRGSNVQFHASPSAGEMHAQSRPIDAPAQGSPLTAAEIAEPGRVGRQLITLIESTGQDSAEVTEAQRDLRMNRDHLDSELASGRPLDTWLRAYAEVRTIGHHLNRVGGLTLMRRVHDTIDPRQHRRAVVLVSYLWDGIGGWWD